MILLLELLRALLKVREDNRVVRLNRVEGGEMSNVDFTAVLEEALTAATLPQEYP